jgi:hypothetical protein
MTDSVGPDGSTPAPDDDFYQHNAEWYAALVRPQLAPARHALATLLPGPIPTGVALEVGPGVGATLDILLDAGATRIYAVEPSRTMRVGLGAWSRRLRQGLRRPREPTPRPQRGAPTAGAHGDQRPTPPRSPGPFPAGCVHHPCRVSLRGWSCPGGTLLW